MTDRRASRFLANIVGLQFSHKQPDILAVSESVTGRDLQRDSFAAVIPEHWPGLLDWLPTARRNAIGLFPKRAYVDLRVKRRIFTTRLSVLSDPESIMQVCGAKSQDFALTNLHLRLLKPSLGGGLIVAEGSAWKEQRRLALKFIAGRRKAAAETDSDSNDKIGARIDHEIESWQSASRAGGEVDLLNRLVQLSIDLLACSVFGLSEMIAHKGLTDSIDAHRDLIENYDLLDGMGVPSWVRSARLKRARALARRFDEEINDAIEQSNHQLLPLLRSGAHTDPRDLIVSIMAGFESVAVTSLWALAIAARQPELVSNILAERPDPAAPMAFKESVSSSLDAFVLEVMRLYPPLPLIYRKALKPVETPVGDFSKGELICMSPWIVHRHRKLWDRPDMFDPERWLGQVWSKTPGYMPFGVGARQCVGMHIGASLIKQIVYRTLRSSHITRNQPQLPAPRASISLRPTTPIYLGFAPR